MQTAKISVSIPVGLVAFVEHYKVTHACRTRSQVIEEALRLLRRQELEQAYSDAGKQSDPEWEATAADGLNDETW